MNPPDPDSLDWDKGNGLLPAVIQHAATGRVLMLGYMSRQSFDETLRRERVVFFSRSRNTLWMKGETSGNELRLVSVAADCDNDTLLVCALPSGPVCHLGTATCFEDGLAQGPGFLAELSTIIADRRGADAATSYTARLLSAGTAKVAQKVGEEGVEVALAAVSGDPEELIEESADLLYHLLVVLADADVPLSAVLNRLAQRHP